MLHVGEIGDLVQEWVDREGRHLPGFCGAYLFGSIATMPEDAPFATYRDVDVIVVLDSGTKRTDENLEIPFKGLMLEVGFIGMDEHRDAEATLARPDRAGMIAATRILADPLGVLAPLQCEVRRHYADPEWVATRCMVEKQMMTDGLHAMLASSEPIPRLLALVPVAFGMAGLLDVARLVVPTSRRALVRLRRRLSLAGRAALFEEILSVCGVETLSRAEVEEFHRIMLAAFDRAVQVKHSILPYSFKVEAHTRPCVNEAIAEMIAEGHHREAAFYLALPYGGVTAIIQHDAPDAERPSVQAEYDRVLDALDLLHPREWQGRVQRARACIEQITQIADASIATT